MKVSVSTDAHTATQAAANLLADWLTDSRVRNVMVAAGNTPLELYKEIASRNLPLSHLRVFALDEYVGVPLEEPRNCANLLRRSVAEAWRIPAKQFFTVSSLESDALASVQGHERRIEASGGLDVIILGLGQNGHLGFNEPGSDEDSAARTLDLNPISTEANRKWFGGDYAPSRGVTVGLKTILAARRSMILAFGLHKTRAVADMVEGKRGSDCPASFLQPDSDAYAFLDLSAAAQLNRP